MFIQVIADGYQSLRNSDIQQINKLEVNGNQSLNGATIRSDVQIGDTFIAFINGMFVQVAV